MAFINWTDDLSVGIASIDEQHKKLIELINDFYNGMINKSTKENLLKMLAGLKEYTEYHFTSEEAHMEKYSYPETEEHKKEHALFVEKINDYFKRSKEGRLLVSLEVTNFIKEWISRHIMVVDKKYTALFQEKGVT